MISRFGEKALTHVDSSDFGGPLHILVLPHKSLFSLTNQNSKCPFPMVLGFGKSQLTTRKLIKMGPMPRRLLAHAKFTGLCFTLNNKCIIKDFFSTKNLVDKYLTFIKKEMIYLPQT